MRNFRTSDVWRKSTVWKPWRPATNFHMLLKRAITFCPCPHSRSHYPLRELYGISRQRVSHLSFNLVWLSNDITLILDYEDSNAWWIKSLSIPAIHSLFRIFNLFTSMYWFSFNFARFMIHDVLCFPTDRPVMIPYFDYFWIFLCIHMFSDVLECKTAYTYGFLRHEYCHISFVWCLDFIEFQ